MKRRSSLTALLAAALLLAPLSACSALPGSGGGASSSEDLALPEVARDAAGADGAFESAPQAVEDQSSRSVIRTGEISIEVADPDTAAEEVSEIARRAGGSVESMTVHRASGDAAAGADLTLRVPEDRLDETFEALTGVGDVVTQSRSAVDVTAEHVDLQARVAALEASVERLTKLMAGADTTTELIEAEAALSQRQQELDGLRAQLKSLEGQVDEATIWVSLGTKSALPGGGPANFWEGLLAGLDSLTAAGAGALVLLGILLPWLALAAVLAVAILLIVRALRARSRARAVRAVQEQREARAAQAEQAARTASAGAVADPAAPLPAGEAAPQYPPTPPSSAL
ncbi:DUF4349 domain-containing protein [Leucobacter sp.]